MTLPWDPTSPPVQPPPGCRDGQRWRIAHTLYTQHRLEDSDTRCRCGELWPCPTYRHAIRALLTAYLQAGPVMIICPTETAICRWCARTIVSHPAHGWVHPHDGYVTCDRPHADAPVATTAEPCPADP
ncbi:hypothetical protein [Salinispora arenicola]|uniref:hypothetical protein n=1 Tax=Salinispora arenicola TaxID=168697 RepID=UPI00037571E4|nr:hypothetical protein [Salinispora arenicola]